ncbi:MAG: serine/threonine protein kinase [Myxococcales bacterium]|nr:serine/threonine protein kinase [Myxococcales bacterium]
MLWCPNYAFLLDIYLNRSYHFLAVNAVNAVNPGSHIGQYRIVRKIGAGGMGTVYLGEHILLGRRAAIKTLLPALSVHKEIVERFFNEARATSAITDNGVVQIFDFGYHVDGTAYIVMELLEGESLQTRIERLGQIAPSDALRIARMVAGSLASAHAHNIVHRDLKPENIFLIHDGEAQNGERTKILDFGICKLGTSDGDPVLTQTGTTMGTPVYMSPEQCRGAGHVDHRSDIYALGCVLFHMLAGRPPFECEGAGEFIVAHLQEEAPAPSTFVPGLSELVDGLLQRCLEKSADDRFQSMTELQHALEYVLARITGPVVVAAPVEPATPIAPGYRSSYDANFGTPMPTQNLRTPLPSQAVAAAGAALSVAPAGEPSVLRSPKKAAKSRRKSPSSKLPSSTGTATGSSPPFSTARGSKPADDEAAVRSGSSGWFVDSNAELPATPTTLGLSTGQDHGRVTSVRRRPQRTAIAIVLFGMLAAAGAFMMATRGDDAVADSSPAIEQGTLETAGSAVAATAPAPAPVVEPTPAVANPVAATGETAGSAAVAEPATPPAAIASTTTADRAAPATKVAAPTKAKKPTKARPKAKARPQRSTTPTSRPSITTTTPDPVAVPAEDLYDTR